MRELIPTTPKLGRVSHQSPVTLVPFWLKSPLLVFPRTVRQAKTNYFIPPAYLFIVLPPAFIIFLFITVLPISEPTLAKFSSTFVIALIIVILFVV